MLLRVLAFASFVSLGLPDGLLGVAWPSMRASFGLGLDALGPLFVAATSGYVASSLLAGPLLARLGIGGLLAVSCATAALALCGYAAAPAWSWVIGFGLLAGAGGGAIDAGLNTFAAVHYSARTVNLLHAFYGVGTTLGPLIMTATLLARAPWQAGYLMVAAAQLLLAMAFAATRGLWSTAGDSATSAARVSLARTVALPAVQVAAVAFFVYVGLEASAGVWLYSLLHESRGLATGLAGGMVSAYWFGLFGGRVAYAVAPLAIRPEAAIRRCIVVAFAAAALLAGSFGGGWDIVAILTLGFASGPIFPSLIATTPTRLGPVHTANAVGLQVGVSALGLAAFPAAAGWLAERVGLEAIPAALCGCWGILLGVVLLLERYHLAAGKSASGG